MQSSGIAIDRSGLGKVVEIYPGASLRLWGFETKGYRASVDIRRELVAHLKGLAPWFSFGPHIDLIVESCDALDAVIAALATRAAALNQYEKPSAQLIAQAKIEGWIALPNQPLEALLG
jgi:predicted nuclease with RNAse H fold